MAVAENSNSLTRLLSDFLLKASKGRQADLEQHPLLQAPAVRALLADWVSRQPAAPACLDADLAMGALADYWERVFKPADLSPAFRSEWDQYLLLAAAYFVPFRRSPGQPSYPQSYAKIGELLADAGYLAGVLADVTGDRHTTSRIEEFCRSLIPSPDDRTRGAVPATTVASARNTALAALAASLETSAGRATSCRSTVVQAAALVAGPAAAPALAVLPPVPVDEPAIREADGVTMVSALAGDGDWPYDRLLDLGDRVERVLADSGARGASPTQGVQARRLAQHLAAIRLEIEPTAEATTLLTDANVHLALRRTGLEETDFVLDRLVGARLLKRVANHWRFAYPALERLFAAEHVADYGVHWVSLHPCHHRLMTWAAAILAQRADDRRNAQFCQDLGRVLGAWSPVSLLDTADLLAPFQAAPTPATARFEQWLAERLRELATIPSGWLQAQLWHCGEQLGVNLGLPGRLLAPEAVVPPAALTAERQATDVPDLLTDLGLPASLADRPNWFDDRHAIRALLDGLRDSSDGIAKRRTAAWLWPAQLQVGLEWVVDPARPWRSHRATALETLAELAGDPSADEMTCTLARSVLARDEHLLGLSASDRDYRVLLFTLQLALGKRLFIGPPAGAWQVASSDL